MKKKGYHKKMDKKEIHNISRSYAMITQLAINLIVIIFGTFFIGVWLDKIFNTSPLFLFIFLVLGMGASFRSLYKLSMSVLPKIDKKIECKEEPEENEIYRELREYKKQKEQIGNKQKDEVEDIFNNEDK